MTYQEFLTNVKTQLSLYIGDDASLQIQKIKKNNDRCYDGLIIIRPDTNISPTIYLTPYYHRYLEGVSMDDIYADILATYRRHLPSENFDTSLFTDYEKAKNRIVLRLVNYEKNKSLLAEIPHFRYLDFAVIFYCLLYADENHQANILIYHHHLDFWGIGSETLYQTGILNTPLLLPHHMESMTDILKSFPSIEAAELEIPAFPMYVLSNCYHTNGATAILYDGLLKHISDRFEQDLVILPSSIHEVILIPVNEEIDFTSYTSMVKEVNETQLKDDEILSDHAYLFSRKSQMLLMQ